jgi:hypothetical protein
VKEGQSVVVGFSLVKIISCRFEDTTQPAMGSLQGRMKINKHPSMSSLTIVTNNKKGELIYHAKRKLWYEIDVGQQKHEAMELVSDEVQTKRQKIDTIGTIGISEDLLATNQNFPRKVRQTKRPERVPKGN